MIAIGMLITWAGYSGVMWGYCLLRDYNVTVPQLFGNAWPAGGGAAASPRGSTSSSGAVPTPSGQVGVNVALTQPAQGGVVAATPSQIANSFPVIS